MRNVVGLHLYFVLSAASLLALAGCAARQQQSKLTPEAVWNARTAQNQQQAPYALQAESTGPVANFTLYNIGNSEMKVAREHFAVVQPGARQVTPYREGSVIIDIPPDATVKPGSTLQGKAMFTGINKLDGLRLVYKPDDQGTYAVIQPKP